MPWNPPPRAWQDDILDALPSSVDETLIARNLRLSPTQRLEQMIAFQEQLDELRATAKRIERPKKS